MTIIQAIPTTGSEVSVTATLPTDYTSAAFKTALANPTLIGGIITVGALPRVFGTETINQLLYGGNQTIKTTMSEISVDLEILRAPSDAGQVILETAFNSRANFTFSVKTPDTTGFSYVGMLAKVTKFDDSPLDGNAKKISITLSIQCPTAIPFFSYTPDPPPPEGD